MKVLEKQRFFGLLTYTTYRIIQVVQSENGMNIKVLEKQRTFVGKILALPSKSEDLPTWVIENIKSFFKSSRMSLQRPKPKNFGKREETGVSTPHVLSMRPYAHIISKHAKKGLLVKICHFIGIKVSCITNKVIPINQICLITQTSNMYPNILEPMICYNPTIKE